MPQSENTCWTVVHGAAGGDPASRAAFAERYGRVVAAYLAARWKLPVDHGDVTDTVQDVFMECFKLAGPLERADSDRPGGFRAFLHGITRNVARRAERKGGMLRHGLRVADLDLDQIEHAGPTLSAVFDRAWAQNLVRQAMGLIMERAERDGGAAKEAATFLRQRHLENLAPKDIAERHGVPVSRVYQSLKDMRTAFRSAVIDTLAHDHPEDSRAELEKRCVELAQRLE